MPTRLTRRTLIGAGVAGTAGAGAYLLSGDAPRARRWLHSAGLLDGPDLAPPAVPVSEVRYESFESTAMKRPVAWGLATPPGGAEVEAVVLCLHGRAASHRFAFDSIGLHRFVAGERLPWAVVSADGGDASYWHRRRDGTDAQATLFDELVPALGVRFGPVPLVLLGWSMGGYGALLAAVERASPASSSSPAIVAVAAASPALWRTFSGSAPGAFDGPADFAAHDVFRSVGALRSLPVRIDCGRDDPFLGVSRELASLLPEAEADFGAGFHDAPSWRRRVPMQLAFFRRVLSGWGGVTSTEVGPRSMRPSWSLRSGPS